MRLDLTDAASIAAWYSVAPARHGPMLSQWWRAWPQFRGAIQAARKALDAA
jgi:hypothetical protein